MSVAALRPGDPLRIGPYRVVGRLGAGGMGTVFAATDGAGARLAVKTVHPHQAQDQDFRARFHREVQVLGRVQGSCLVPLLDADTTAEVPWLATAYVPGLTLHQHVQEHGPLSGIHLLLFAAGCSAALAAVHSAGVVHRDLKPANVILSPLGPRVLDFGIARVADGTAVTRTGVLTGTPGWISPEQYCEGVSTAAGDVFVLGALIAYAATGRLPFGQGAADAVAFRVMSAEPDLAGIDAALLGVVESALAKDPPQRPPAAAMVEQTALLLSQHATQALDGARERPTLVADLMTSQWHQPAAEDPAWSVAVPPVRPSRRRGVLLLAVGTMAFVLAAAGAWTALHHSPASTTARKTPPVSAFAQAPTHTPAAAAPVPAGAAAPTITEVVTFTPWTLDGEPAQGITVADHHSGHCWEQAMGSSRDDAWRCDDDQSSSLYDPCFASQNNAPHEGEMLCPVDGSLTRMAWLVPDGPLPDKPAQGVSSVPLAIVLADGQSCYTAGGAGSILSTVNDKSLSYACPHGDLYGAPDTSANLWTIAYRPSGASTSSTMAIAKVDM